MTVVRVLLDQATQNSPIATQGILQGNNTLQFEITLSYRGSPVPIPDGSKPNIFWVYDKTGIIYKLSASSPDYDQIVSIAGNTLTIAPTIASVNEDGMVTLIIQLDGIYTFSCFYKVAPNPVYKAKALDINTDGIYASANLSNVTDADFLAAAQRAGVTGGAQSDPAFLAQAKKVGLMENSMEDVDLDKLGEKINATDEGKQIRLNSIAAGANKQAISDAADPRSFDRELKANPAFLALQNRHSATAGLTPAEIKALFYTTRREATTPVDFTAGDLGAATAVLFVAQFTSKDQTFTQPLPPVSSNKMIMVEVLRSTGITGGKLVLTPSSGDFIDGASAPLEVTDEGYCGVLLPLPQENGWQWLHYSSTAVPIMQFKDPISGEEFPASKAGSLDKSINMRKLPDGRVDFSAAPDGRHSGIMATLGWSQLHNSKFAKSRMYFGDIKIKGDAYVYPDTDKKSFVLSDMSEDGNGTTYFCGLYLPITAGEVGQITQDGQIRLDLADDKDTVLTDMNGRPAGVTVLYKSGDTEREELYCGEILVKGQKTVHLQVEELFQDQEIVTISPDTAVCFQAVTKEQTSGEAFLAFCEHTGYMIRMSKRYIGTNYMNLAQFLDFTEPEKEITPGVYPFGDETYMEVVGNPIKAGITNNRITLKDDGAGLPVFSLYKRVKSLETKSIVGAALNLSTKITNKMGAVTMSLIRFDGSGPVPTPGVQSYQNTVPTFNPGWSVVDSLSIDEDISAEYRVLRKTFTAPDARELAVVMYPRDSQIPTEITLWDMEVDVVPPVTRFDVPVKDGPREQSLKYSDTWVKGAVMCPSGDASYRYTCNDTKTRIPIGVISGGGPVENDHSWTDAGSSDPNRTQGNAEFSDERDVSFSYASIKAGNDADTENTVDVWLELNGVEIQGSRYTGKIGAKATPAIIPLPNVSFKVKAGDSVAAFMQSDKKDGFYLIAYPDGVPLFRWEMELKGIVPGKP